MADDVVPPPDAPARDRVRHELDATLFVQAGAGSGKTTALVGRVLALVTEGADGADPVSLAEVAAITFTEKAGAELRERLRRALEEAATDPARASRARAALDELDGAAIGTLHSFAQRILSEHPVEAGLPPRVEVLDEVTSGVQFERRWARFSDELFADPAYERTLLLLYAAGTRDSTPHALARTFDSNWDLVATHVKADEPPPGEVTSRALAVLDGVEAACAAVEECADRTDLLAAKLAEVAEWAHRTRGAVDEHALLEELRRAREPRGLSFKSRGGKAALWRIPVTQVKADLLAAGEAIDTLLTDVATECARHLGSAIRRFTLASAEERRRAGTLEFHDLLVLARALLRDPDHGAAARTALHQRYQRLLLDEFQDTDPIQVELAVRIAAADPGSIAAGAAPWSEVEVAPGRLFVVGDPKQSIYRFRRADIALFLEAADRFGGGPGAPDAVTLSANFRTVPGVIGWVNTTFAALMAEDPSPELPFARRPPYVPLDPIRDDPPTDGGPTVAVMGRTPHPLRTSSTDVRRAEAAEVAATVRRVVGEGWRVGDGREADDTPRWRPARLGDITILVPARTSLPYLEDALSDSGIAYRAEASSLVYASRAVRDLLMVVRAVADPTDSLAVVSALRTPLFGCGDDDLYRYRVEHGGSWSPTVSPPDTLPADDPVVAGLARLGAWHRAKTWTSPSGLLEEVVRDRRALEMAFAEGRPRDVWRRLRFVVDQARAWTDATGGDVRGYLDWVALQTVEGARVAEAVLPETDDDAVRIMTIHAAKGLEFPVTIVSGLSSYPGHGPKAGDARFTSDGDVAYYLGKHAETTEFQATRPLDEQMSFDERVRLLYVAATRAQDHLVVSLHRVERRSTPAPMNRTNAELLVAGMGDEVLDGLPDSAPADADPGGLAPLPATPVDEPEPYATWRTEHEAALARAARPSTVAATALSDEAQPLAEDAGPGDAGPDDVEADHGAAASDAPPTEPSGQLVIDFAAVAVEPDLDHSPDGGDAGLRKRPGDMDRPPWLKGRYGTAVGRAVHGVLQTVPLGSRPDGPEVDAAVAAQAQAEAVTGREGVIAQLVGDALRSPSVRAAAQAPHWRELYASAPVGAPGSADGRLLEGYVDLLYRTPDGLVVVDYKTAATLDPTEIDRRVAGYRFQGASYALVVGRTTGEPVARVTFCFLTPQGAVERHLTDLDTAIAEVEAAVAGGDAHQHP